MKVYVACIVKLEGRYLREFCDHYFTLGFDGIRLYDNNAYSNPMSDLEVADAEVMKGLSTEYEGRVEIIPFPGALAQLNAYTHTVVNLCGDPENWCAMFDADEFLVLKKHRNIKEFITETSKLQPMCGSIGVNWVMFDTNDHETYAPGRVVDRFTRRVATTDYYIKSIVQCCRVSQSSKLFLRKRVGFNLDPHFAFLIDGYKNVSPEGGVVIWSQHPEGSDQIAALHHYFTKSKEEWLQKVARGKADKPEHRNVSEMEMVGERIQDTCAQHPVYIPPEAPQPEAEAQPEAPQPEAEAPQREVPQPEAEAPQPEAPQPETEAPQPEVPQPEAEAPQPEAPQPEAEAKPEVVVPESIIAPEAQQEALLPPSPTSVNATASTEHIAQLALDVV
jgi:hypothetical protein